MVKYIFYVFALSGLFALPTTAFSETAEQAPRTVQVSGDAEIRVAPNEALITMSTEARDANLSTATQKVDKSVISVLGIFKKLGIAQEHIQTDYVDVSPHYAYCENAYRDARPCDATKVEFYTVKKGVTVRLQDLSQFDTLMRDALLSGVSQIGNVQFTTTDLRKYRDQARNMAVNAAKEKAEAVAGALGQKIGKPRTINLSNNGWQFPSYYGARNMGNANAIQNIATNDTNGGGVSSGNAEPSTSLGQIKVTASVDVIFEME